MIDLANTSVGKKCDMRFLFKLCIVLISVYRKNHALIFSDSERKVNSEYERLLSFCLSKSVTFVHKLLAVCFLI